MKKTLIIISMMVKYKSSMKIQGAQCQTVHGEAGLHQMIEEKEECEQTGQNQTIARISYQRFFSRYLKLSGMTGTAIEVAAELNSSYGLLTCPVPTHKPSKRRKTKKHSSTILMKINGRQLSRKRFLSKR